MNLATLLEKYQVNCHQLLHIGAHLGEEAAEYDKAGFPVWWVEANPEVLPKLRANLAQYPEQYVIEGLIADRDDEILRFHITNYDGMSSSIFQFDKHPIYSPDTVFVNEREIVATTIRTLCDQYDIKPDFLNLDIQGAELLALRGAGDVLRGVKWIYTEVSTDTVYAGGAQMSEIDEFLSPDFVRVETDLGMHGGSHGDAFYVRR